MCSSLAIREVPNRLRNTAGCSGGVVRAHHETTRSVGLSLRPWKSERDTVARDRDDPVGLRAAPQLCLTGASAHSADVERERARSRCRCRLGPVDGAGVATCIHPATSEVGHRV